MPVTICKTDFGFRPDEGGSRILTRKMPGGFSMPTQIF